MSKNGKAEALGVLFSLILIAAVIYLGAVGIDLFMTMPWRT